MFEIPNYDFISERVWRTMEEVYVDVTAADLIRSSFGGAQPAPGAQMTQLDFLWERLVDVD